MPHISQMIVSKYFSKGDVQAAPLIVTIRGLQLETFGSGPNAEQRWILYFQEHAKGLKLNNTNLKLLGAGLGENSDGWIGKRIKLWLDPSVQMAGQMVGGVRIQLSRSNQPPPAGWPAAGAAQPRFDPMTGQPVAQPAAPAGARFDPMTGRPLGAVDTATGEIQQPAAGGAPADPDFDDDIPF